MLLVLSQISATLVSESQLFLSASTQSIYVQAGFRIVETITAGRYYDRSTMFRDRDYQEQRSRGDVGM